MPEQSNPRRPTEELRAQGGDTAPAQESGNPINSSRCTTQAVTLGAPAGSASLWRVAERRTAKLARPGSHRRLWPPTTIQNFFLWLMFGTRRLRKHFAAELSLFAPAPG